MPERVVKCPNCGASLAPHRFARTATCGHCGTVVTIDEASISASRFREAYRAWAQPRESDGRAWKAVGGEWWASLGLVAHGEIADLHLVERAKWPPQRGLLKVVRDEADVPMMEAERQALARLLSSQARGAFEFARLVPQVLASGAADGSARATATVLRFVPGFDATFEQVRAAYPRGVDGAVAVWMWRRILEVLSFVHRTGLVHGAVLPPHLLVERGEHGVRLVGYGCAGVPGDPLAAVVTRHERLYDPRLLSSLRLSPGHDVVMSARSIGYVLGADADGGLPSSVPPPLRSLVEAASRGDHADDAWALREEVGSVATSIYGPPRFHPLELPFA